MLKGFQNEVKMDAEINGYRKERSNNMPKSPKYHQNGDQNPPTLGSGVLDLLKLSSPLPPSALGPSPPDVGPNSSIFTLYVYWGQILVDMDQILPRGGIGPLSHQFEFKRIGTILGPFQGKRRASCTVWPLPQTCRGLSAR